MGVSSQPPLLHQRNRRHPNWRLSSRNRSRPQRGCLFVSGTDWIVAEMDDGNEPGRKSNIQSYSASLSAPKLLLPPQKKVRFQCRHLEVLHLGESYEFRVE